MKKIGFIGLGTMGKPMALNLIKAGYDMYVVDTCIAAVHDAAEAGANVCSTPAEVAYEVDVLITMLPNEKIVDSVLNGEDGFMQNAKSEAIIVDMSTVSPIFTRDMAKKAKLKGIEYVDAPVSGGQAGAQKGTLAIMIGGEESTVKKLLPVFEAMGKKIYHIGDSGAGNTMKLVNNMLLGMNMAAVAEAVSMADKMGLDLNKFSEVVKESSGNSYAFTAKMDSFILSDNFEPGFAVDLQYKDLELAIATAKAENIPVPMASLGQQFYEIARAKGLGNKDISSLVKIWADFGGNSSD